MSVMRRMVLFYVFAEIHFGGGDNLARGWIYLCDEVLFIHVVNNEERGIVLLDLAEDRIHIFDDFGIPIAANIGDADR